MDGLHRSPKEVEELGLFEELFKIDTSIDKDQTDQSKATLWYRRAKIAGKLQLFNGESLLFLIINIDIWIGLPLQFNYFISFV